MRAIPLLIAALACGPAAAPPPPAPEVELALHTPAAKVGTGETVVVEVHSWAAPGWTVDPPAPAAEGLRFSPAGEEGPWQDGGRSRWSRRYIGEGPDGSYVVQLPGLEAQGPGGAAQTVAAEPLFIDIGVPGPSGGPMAGLESPPPPDPLPWGWAVAVGCATAGAALGARWAARRARRAPPPQTPQDRALAAWAAARASTAEGPALAFALSQVLRQLLEELSGWPATAHTSREILRFVSDAALLPAGLQPRAARVLDATDLLKYAGEGGHAGLFEELDADLRAVVEATRRPSPGGAGA
jgi:hypothetical protein